VIRIVLPADLRALARIEGHVELQLTGEVTQRQLLDALEARFPVLRGTIRDRETHRRRPHVRFFACSRDLSHEGADASIPEAVVTGAEPFLIVGAMSGG
jgi:sulfur-carrier protein